MNFNKFLALVEKIRSNQANYQPVVICHLSKCQNFSDTQKSIAEKLASKNGKTDFKPFMGSCPVWKILVGKSMIVKVGDSYKLPVKMTPAQKKQISKICMEML